MAFGGGGGAWNVVGDEGGNVALYANTETTGPLPYNPATTYHVNVEDGVQAADLSGSLDNGARIGIEQSIGTLIGGVYTLSFYEGDFAGQTSSIDVFLNDPGTYLHTNAFQTATELTAPAGWTTQWQFFTYTFTATQNVTTLAFINNSASLGPSVVNIASVDNVTLDGPPPAVPEPSTMLLFGGSLCALGLIRKRRLSSN
jgi:hypothetical protein